MCTTDTSETMENSLATKSALSLHGKRVLHVLGASKYGGDSLYVFDLLLRFKELGGDGVVCSTDPDVIQRAEELGIAVIQIASFRREISPLKDWQTLIALRNYLCENSFDIVHTHTSKGGFIGRLAARWARVPKIVHTIHGFSFHDSSSFLQKLIYKNLERFAGYFCDYAISVNHADRKMAIEDRILKPSQVVSILNGVEKNRFDSQFDKTSFRQSIGVNETDFLVGTVGRFAYQKDPETFIRAVDLVRSIDPHTRFKFVYVGDGPERAKIEDLVQQLKLDNLVDLVGFRKNVEDYLRSFDLYVSTARYEGLPMTLIEALAAGIPILATNVKGNNEVAKEDFSVLVPMESPEAVARAIVELASDHSKRNMMIDRGRKAFEKSFTKEKMINETFELYGKMLNE